MTSIGESDLKVLEDSLLNTSGDVGLHNRFRALFTLKSLKSEDAVRVISAGFQDPSALLKHELAYCLGQMKKPSALPVLESVLRNTAEDPMVRHEVGQSQHLANEKSRQAYEIGCRSDGRNIPLPPSLPILQEYLTDSNRSVRETCEIAIAKIEWDNSDEGKRHTEGLSDSTIPPKTYPMAESLALKAKLLDTSLPLFERYRAMFALRNVGTPAAVDALASGFSDDSALFKHEIAFVFGQLLSAHSVPALLKVLENSNESEMVRHEAAEALGGIGTPEDAPLVVRQSCEVAIDLWEHENSDEFQYANGLGPATPAISIGA
ncbi:armadillo-type protein [Mycena olivaceomarginata]|nr:armadillo-type protein [Mycena olivaceomarginata]